MKRSLDNPSPPSPSSPSSPSSLLPSSLPSSLPSVWLALCTLECAEAGCVSCLHKLPPQLDPEGAPLPLPPNKRPESCPRHLQAERLLTAPLHPHSRVLTVGDGDLSLSLGLARAGLGLQVVASSLESARTLERTYPSFPSTSAALRDAGAQVLFEVDATRLDEHLPEGARFDAVLWMFPCVCAPLGADGQVSELEQNRALVAAFLASALPFLSEPPPEDGGRGFSADRGGGRGGRVLVGHKTSEPFSWWDLPSIAGSNGFRHVGSVALDVCCYPEYVNRRALSSRSFPHSDAQIFVFEPVSRAPVCNPLSDLAALGFARAEDVAERVRRAAADGGTREGRSGGRRVGKRTRS